MARTHNLNNNLISSVSNVNEAIAFTSFHSHGSVGQQRDSYLSLADAEVENFQPLASKMQLVKSQLFFVYMSVAGKKASI